MDEILNMALKEMVRSGYEDLLAAGLVLTGGASLLPGLTEMAEQVFDMPVRIGYPRNVGGLLEQINTPRTTTAVGLVLFGSRTKNFAVKEQAGVINKLKHWLRGII